MTAPVKRRRPPRRDTERGELVLVSALHLEDLKRAHGEPPPDVKVSLRRAPRFLTPEPTCSYFTSPAALCAELAEQAEPAEPVEPMEPVK